MTTSARAAGGPASRALIDDLSGAVFEVPPGSELVVVVDTLVRGVHYPPTTRAADVGYKSVAVNLSDLAAMGAWPMSAIACVATRRSDSDWLSRFEHGAREALAPFRAELHVSRRRASEDMVTVQAHGAVPGGEAMLRSGAMPGDVILVTGNVGDAGGALHAHYGGEAPRLRGRTLARLRRRLARPTARVAAGQVLRGYSSAAIDLSDGLVRDLGHVLAASGVGARIRADRLPLSSALRRALPESLAREVALSRGDDYELLVTMQAAAVTAARDTLAAIGCALTPIGRIEVEPGLRLVDEHAAPIAPGAGYEHFTEASGSSPGSEAGSRTAGPRAHRNRPPRRERARHQPPGVTKPGRRERDGR